MCVCVCVYRLNASGRPKYILCRFIAETQILDRETDQTKIQYGKVQLALKVSNE